MTKTEYSRKIDNVGRLVIPSKLRLLLGIEPNKDYDFYVHEMEGKKYLCICTGDADLKKAMNKVRSAGLKVGRQIERMFATAGSGMNPAELAKKLLYANFLLNLAPLS